jgi:hypothetical protein
MLNCRRGGPFQKNGYVEIRFVATGPSIFDDLLVARDEWGLFLSVEPVCLAHRQVFLTFLCWRIMLFKS